MPIAVEIVTQEKAVFREDEADMVIVPAAEGDMGVLPRHAPVLTTLRFGELIVRKGRAEERFIVYGGVVDVRPDKVVVLADLAESSFAIDEAEAEAARERARRLLESGIPENQNEQTAMALRRAELSLRVARKVKQQGGSILRIIEDEEEEEA
jgi:F-type H+-transporting ATPase subunit epsilon